MYSFTLVPRDGDFWNLPKLDQKWFLASASSRVESSWRGVGEESPSDSPRKTSCSSPRSGWWWSQMPGNPGLRWMVSDVDLLQRLFTVPSATGNIKLSPFIGVNTSFALRLLAWISNASISSNSSMSATIMSPFQMLPRMQCMTEEYTWQDFWAELMQSRLVFRRNRVMIDHCSKRYCWSVEGHSEPPFLRCVSITKFILNILQIAVTFHGICPPFFVQASLPFFHSAHCSLSNPICFRSVWCPRTMIPGKISTGCAKFLGIVCVHDFRLPIRLQELLQAPLCFLRSFCFARIRLDPLGGQVLHHDCMSKTVSRFTTFTENFVICCN